MIQVANGVPAAAGPVLPIAEAAGYKLPGMFDMFILPMRDI